MNDEQARAHQEQINNLRRQYFEPNLGWVPIVHSWVALLNDGQELPETREVSKTIEKAQEAQKRAALCRFENTRPIIIKMKGEGYSGNAIAKFIGISQTTITKHWKRIKEETNETQQA